MKNLSLLLGQSWKTLFRDRRSFLIIFLFQAFPGALILLTIFGFFAAMKWVFPLFSNQIYDFIESVTTPFGIISLIVVLGLILLFFIALQVVCYYLAQRGLTQLFFKKKITFGGLLSQWRGVGVWMGTGLIIALYFIIFFIVCFILAFISSYIHDSLVIVSFGLLFFGFIFLWVSLYFSIPAYFIDNNRYFQATKNAFSLVRNRWWRTFGYVLVVLIMAAVLSFLVIILENILGYGLKHLPSSFADMPSFGIVLSILYSLYAFVQLSINVVVQLLLSSYSFQLYSFYKKNAPNTLK